MFLNPESFLIFLHFLFQLRGQTGADGTGLNSIRMRLSAGHTSICLTPPVLEHWERTVMDFSAIYPANKKSSQNGKIAFG